MTTLEESNATASRVLKELPQADWAHIGTHGFFNSFGMEREDRQRKSTLENWTFHVVGLPRTSAEYGTRRPLAYTGLVLAGANGAL